MTATQTDWFSDAGSEMFFEELEEGHRWQFYIATLLMRESLLVRCNMAIDRRPLSERYLKHVDSVDIDVGESLDRLLRLEVKSRNFAFGPGGEDHPYPTTFLGPTSHWNAKADHLPVATVIVSTVTKEAFWVPTWTRDKWVQDSTWDSKRKIPEVNWAAPSECFVPWDSLVPCIRAGVFT